ncbi:unnamed protein product [Moneuplotes crassus]|uniref:Uncharacterized protein n=1 Tax=Euplotes crassus TaxID=5936 RepID=A0AAD1XTB1_EUPCR|nr:unnamed protein product [Moneuplotes crassus]
MKALFCSKLSEEYLCIVHRFDPEHTKFEQFSLEYSVEGEDIIYIESIVEQIIEEFKQCLGSPSENKIEKHFAQNGYTIPTSKILLRKLLNLSVYLSRAIIWMKNKKSPSEKYLDDATLASLIAPSNDILTDLSKQETKIINDKEFEGHQLVRYYQNENCSVLECIRLLACPRRFFPCNSSCGIKGSERKYKLIPWSYYHCGERRRVLRDRTEPSCFRHLRFACSFPTCAKNSSSCQLSGKKRNQSDYFISESSRKRSKNENSLSKSKHESTYSICPKEGGNKYSIHSSGEEESSSMTIKEEQKDPGSEHYNFETKNMTSNKSKRLQISCGSNQDKPMKSISRPSNTKQVKTKSNKIEENQTAKMEGALPSQPLITIEEEKQPVTVDDPRKDSLFQVQALQMPIAQISKFDESVNTYDHTIHEEFWRLYSCIVHGVDSFNKEAEHDVLYLKTDDPLQIKFIKALHPRGANLKEIVIFKPEEQLDAIIDFLSNKFPEKVQKLMLNVEDTQKVTSEFLKSISIASKSVTDIYLKKLVLGEPEVLQMFPSFKNLKTLTMALCKINLQHIPDFGTSLEGSTLQILTLRYLPSNLEFGEEDPSILNLFKGLCKHGGLNNNINYCEQSRCLETEDYCCACRIWNTRQDQRI